MNEVLVVGGGMAGCIAALRARQQGAKVRVVRRALGATALSSGAVDVASDPVAPGGSWQAHRISPLDAARAWARLRPGHPYGVLAGQLDRLEESLLFAAASLPGLLCPPLPHNALLPTPLGTVKPAAMGLQSVIGTDVGALPAKVALVHFPTHPAFEPRLLAQGISEVARSLGLHVEVTVVSSPFLDQLQDASLTPYELGERLERPGALERLAEGLRGGLPEGVGAVLFPPVLGRRQPDLHLRLAGLLGGVRCAEVPSPAPSLPGLRLQEALDQALLGAGVQLDEGEVGGARIQEGIFTLGEEALRPGAVVLATGKYIGGGIARGRGFRETVLDLPVFAAGRQVTAESLGELTTEDIVAEQAAFRAGLRVDASLHPLGADGRPAYLSLFAAGAVLSGYDPATDKTGLGVAIFTGFLAGEAAALCAPGGFAPPEAR